MEKRLQPMWCLAPDNIGQTVIPLIKRLNYVWENQTETDQKRRVMPSSIGMAPNNIADNTSFHYFMLNIFKSGCMSHVSVRPDLAIPLSLMLVLKYSRGIHKTEKRKKALFISLSHPIEIAESLLSHCLGRSVRQMLNGKMAEKDWPRLTRAAGIVYDLGIDFWKEGFFLKIDQLNRIIESSDWPYGLVVINDSTGQLEESCHGIINPVQQLKDIQSLASELNLPVIIINSHLQKEIINADVFDHVAQLRDDLDRYQLFIAKADRKAYGNLSFVMSQTCNILEDALSNFTTTKPANYNSGSDE